MTARERTGILGGTLDPIHVGHLEAAEAARQALALDTVLILPARTPPHRPSEPRASGFHRFAMAALAVAARERMAVSDLELLREGPSYTSLTLDHLHRFGFVASQLFFITGSDAFAEITTWHDYPRLLDLCHFVVIARPGAPLGELSRHVPGIERRVREPVTEGRAELPPSVFLIDAKTPSVSSTDIRRRVSAGESLDGLVPQVVAAHIRRCRLYSPDTVAVR